MFLQMQCYYFYETQLTGFIEMRDALSDGSLFMYNQWSLSRIIFLSTFFKFKYPPPTIYYNIVTFEVMSKIEK